LCIENDGWRLAGQHSSWLKIGEIPAWLKLHQLAGSEVAPLTAALARKAGSGEERVQRQWRRS